MFNVTDNACAQLANLLEQSNAEDSQAARFVPTKQGLELALDQPRDGDKTFDHDGRTVLLLEEGVAEALADKTLDVQKTEEGQALVLNANGEDKAEAG